MTRSHGGVGRGDELQPDFGGEAGGRINLNDADNLGTPLCEGSVGRNP